MIGMDMVCCSAVTEMVTSPSPIYIVDVKGLFHSRLHFPLFVCKYSTFIKPPTVNQNKIQSNTFAHRVTNKEIYPKIDRNHTYGESLKCRNLYYVH